MKPAPEAAEVPLIQQSVEAVETRIRPYVRLTPVLTIDRAEFGLAPGPLTIKLELTQHSGSFKVRGAFTNLLLREIPDAGVAAASGGNHGAAVAYAAQVLGIPARIFVPEVSSPAKVSRIRGYGADLVIEGATYSDALAVSQDWVAGSGALPIPAYDQPETILGAGTTGLELRRQAPEATTILAAVGAGGLLSGIATAVLTGASAQPSPRLGLRVVGVEPEGAPTMTAALAAGGPADAPAGSIAVDSLAPRRVGDLTYAVVARHVHSVVLVTDEAIRTAQAMLWERLRIVAEPGGSAALAALLSGRYQPEPDEHVAVVLSGANTIAVDLSR